MPIGDANPERSAADSRDWRNHWYPLTFTRKLRSDAPMPLTLLDEPLVLYRDAEGVATCVTDRCPHRSTPLSLGRMSEGRLECRYHGWQFGGGGRCEQIPTLGPGDPIPRAADASAHPTEEVQGVVWVWLGEPAHADRSAIRHDPEIDAPGWAHVDMIHEFDLDHGLMLENLLDPSHLPFTHEGTLAKRRDAQPLEIEMHPHERGIRGTVRRARKSSHAPQRFSFDPPCTIRLDLVPRAGWKFIQVQHCVPLEVERPRMRLLSRMVRNWLTWAPGATWLTHLGSRRVLDQDTAMLLGQQARLARGAEPWNCPVGADRLAVEYRRWRDEMHALPRKSTRD